MIPLADFPELVQHYAPYFSSVFSAEALIEFKRYISGLIVCENKTVDGINAQHRDEAAAVWSSARAATRAA